MSDDKAGGLVLEQDPYAECSDPEPGPGLNDPELAVWERFAAAALTRMSGFGAGPVVAVLAAQLADYMLVEWQRRRASVLGARGVK